MNRFRHTVSVLSLVMVLLLLAGCLPKAGVTEYTLTVNVKPEGAAEVEGVAEKYKKNAVATFKLIANEGYEFVEWEGDVKPTETDDGQWQIIMDGDKTLTATFEVTEEEPDELEEAIAAAEAAIAALPEEITLDDAEAIAAARALVEAVFELDEEAEIEGIEKLEAAEAELARLQAEKALAEAIAAAEAAIEDLPEVITLEDADQVAEARALVEAVFELDEEAEIEGIEKLEAAEAELARLQAEKALAEAIAAAEAAIEVLPEVITLEDADQVAEARALVNAVLAIDEDAEIEGIEKLEAAEEALQTLGWNPVNEDLVADALKKANVGLNLETAFRGEELDLPEELTVGAYSYVLIWTTDSPDVVEIEEGKAKITRPEETTTVTLTATLGYDISAQAETKPQSFDVQIKVWGLVSELKRLADSGMDKKFKELLEILVPDYDKNLVEEYLAAIVDRLKLETKEELLQVIAAVNTRVLSAVNKAVAAYFAATTKSERVEALGDLKQAVTALGQKVKDWVDDDEFIEENYLPALKGGVSTIEELQAIISQVNLDVAEELVAGVEANPWSSDDVAEAKDFVEAITESKAAQKALLDRLDAVIAVNAVLNPGEKNMVTVLTEQSFENVKEVLNEKYYAAILGDDGFEEGTRVTVADIQAVIDQVNAEHVSYLIGKVVAAAEAESLDTDALEAALTELKTFVGATVWSDDAASISSNEENLKQYGEAIKEQQPTTVEEIIAILVEANTVYKINKATGAEALAKIIWDLKVAEFINLANEDARKDVARAVRAPADKPYKSTAEFKAAVVEVVATYLELIEAVETAGDKVGLAEALTGAFEFKFISVAVTRTMVDRVWEYMAREDFKGFKSITEIVIVAGT